MRLQFYSTPIVVCFVTSTKLFFFLFLMPLAEVFYPIVDPDPFIFIHCLLDGKEFEVQSPIVELKKGPFLSLISPKTSQEVYRNLLEHHTFLN